MKPKTLIPFVVVLALLGGLVAFRSMNKPTESIAQQSGLEKVAAETVTAEAIKRIELSAGATPEEKVTLAREGEGWIVASHFNAPVNKEVIDGYLKKLADMRGEARATATGDEQLATYSLKDGEAFHVTAFGDGEEPVLHLLFGKAPDFKSVFFRKAGDSQVYVEANDLRKEAGVTGDDLTTKPTPDKWMNKEVAKLEQDKVTKLAYKTPDKEFVIEKKVTQAVEGKTEGEGESAVTTPPTPGRIEWLMASGGIGEPGAEVKTSGIERIFGRLKALNASNLIDPVKKAELGLDAPPFRVAISREGEGDLILLGAHKDPAGPGHLMIEGAAKEVIYEVSKFNFEYLFVKGSDLYDLPKLALEADKVDRIELNGPAGRAVLVKDGENWKAEEPQLAFELDQEKVKDLVNTVATVQMQDYADTPVPFTHSLTVSAAGVARTLQGGGAAPGFEGVYAALDGDARSYAINKLEADKLFLAPKDFYTLEAFKVPAADIIGATLQHEGKTVALAKVGADWTVAVDGGAPIAGDPQRIGGLTDMLSTLRFNDINPAPRAADWAPLMTVEFTTNSGATHKLNISPLEGEMHLVQSDANPSLFLLDQDNVTTFKFHFNEVQAPAPEIAEGAPSADAAASGLPPGLSLEDLSEAMQAPAAPAEGITLSPTQ